MKKANISDESKALHKMFRDGEIDEQTLEDSMGGLALLPPPETALDVYSRPLGLDPYLDSVKDKITEFKASPPPLDTEAGRKKYRSMARKISSFKTALDAMGKELVDELKDKPKRVDAERKRIRELLDEWRDDVKKPADDWEAEQTRIEAEKKAAEDAAALAIQIEADHEIAILLDEKYEREAEQAKEKLAAEQKARYEDIAAEAAAKATKDAEERAAQAKLDADLAIEAEKRRAVEAELAAERAHKKAEDDRVAALAKAEQDKLDAIEVERKRVESERLEQERKQQELEQNRAHVGKKRKEAKEALMADCSLTEDQAKQVVLAIARNAIANITINY